MSQKVMFVVVREALELPMHHSSQNTRNTSTFCQQRQQEKEPTRAKSLLTIKEEGASRMG